MVTYVDHRSYEGHANPRHRIMLIMLLQHMVQVQAMVLYESQKSLQFAIFSAF